MGHTKTHNSKMATTFRSTKGASKQRRDLINTEISALRDILPLPDSARQRLSQLQVMSLACCFIRKCNYFTRLFGNTRSSDPDAPFEFSQAMMGFLLITTREGKLLYISDNVTEYLGHSMVDMLTQGDSLYDIIDKRDHAAVQAELLQPDYTPSIGEQKTFFCRMNVSRSFRRHAGFGDHKVMHVRGHFIQPLLGDHYGSQPVFMATCTPLITPDVKESAMQHNTLMFQSVHGLDMSYIEIAPNAEFHLGYSDAEMKGKSWYGLLHPEDIHDAKEKHVQLVKSSHEMGCMLTVRLQAASGAWIWVNMVMHIRQPFVCDNGDPAIVCNNHVISECEAPQFKMQSQLYSSHIARSPEFLPNPTSSPPHTITQVSTDSDSMSYSGQDDGPVSLYGQIGVIPASSLGESGQNNYGMLQAAQQPTVPQQVQADAGRTSPQQQQRLDQKQLLRQDILNRLKRKMQMEGECRPVKQPRISSPEHRDHPSQARISITGSVFTQPLGYGHGMLNNSNNGFGAVLAPLQNGPVYSQLSIKKEVVVPESPKIHPKAAGSVIDVQHPMTPLTPESTCSESRDGLATQLCVEVNDAAVVPSSLLTPDSSPQSSPVHSSQPYMNDLDDLSFFEVEVPGIQHKVKQEPHFPDLDSFAFDNFFSEEQLEPMLAPLVRPTKPHPNPQSRIAEIAAALKESEHEHATRHSLNGSSSSPIPVMVEALDQVDSSASLAQSVTEALLDLARSHRGGLTLADLTGSFLLSADSTTAPGGEDDQALKAFLEPLSDGAPSPLGGDMEFQHLEDFSTNSPSHGEVDQLSKAVFDSTL